MNDKPLSRSVLVLWNQIEEDVYEHLRECGATPLPWDPERTAAEVRTVREELDDLIESIRLAGHRVACINVRDDLELLLASVRLHQPDVVFNLIEYFYNDQNLEAGVVGLYELLGYPFTGSDGYALSLCQRKHHTKLVLESAGLPTAPHFVVESLDTPLPDSDQFDSLFPLIVKPALEDASGGIENDSVVRTHAELVARVCYVLSEFEQPALVEQYIAGREIHVAILGNHDPEVLPLFEMRFMGEPAEQPDEWRPHIVSYSGKWDPLSRDFYRLEPVCPATDVDPQLEQLLGAMAVRAYRVTGCRDYARIDMRIAADGAPYILEVNPNPDLTDGSAFIMCALASGRSYVQILDEIIALAIDRDLYDDDDDDAPTDHLGRKYWLQARVAGSRASEQAARAHQTDPDEHEE